MIEHFGVRFGVALTFNQEMMNSRHLITWVINLRSATGINEKLNIKINARKEHIEREDKYSTPQKQFIEPKNIVAV